MERLCTRCLARYEKLSGKSLAGEFEAVSEQDCAACRGIFLRKEEMLGKALELLKEYEIRTFMAGNVLTDKIMDKEKELKEKLGIGGVNGIKQEVNREFALELERLGLEADLKNPDAQIVFDYIGKRVDLQLKPLYVYGRYLKLERGLPQTKWPCRWCAGRGCKKCDFKGKMYAESVEELIAPAFMRTTNGKRHSLHGSGREDIDVRMLGSGRPFVFEVEEPVKRRIDLQAIERETNEANKGRVQVLGLRFSDKSEVQRIKAEEHAKKYEALVEVEGAAFTEGDVEKVNSINGLELEQFTPERVEHRRAKLVRKRKVRNAKVAGMEGGRMRVALETDSGTYVKEFISGDDGRTKPSLSSLLGKKLKCVELDVVGVEGN